MIEIIFVESEMVDDLEQGWYVSDNSDGEFYFMRQQLYAQMMGWA